MKALRGDTDAVDWPRVDEYLDRFASGAVFSLQSQIGRCVSFISSVALISYSGYRSDIPVRVPD